MIDCIQFREGQINDVQFISKTFKDFVQPGPILEKLEEGKSLTWVATLGKKVVGTIEVRDGHHISLLFVDDNYHKLGIAKKLVSLATEKDKLNTKVTEISVHSSPYALEIYKRMGFKQLEEEQEQDGIRYIPMKKKLSV